MDMRFVIWLLFTILFAHLTHSKRSISLGGIFHEDNYEDEAAFKYAIRRNNMIYNKFHIDPIIHKVSKLDPFKAGKIACNMTEHGKGVAAIIGPQSATCTSIVQSICKTLEIPQIQTNWMANMQYHPMIVNLHPDPLALAKAYADLITAMQWSSFTILYETDEGLMRLQEVLQLHGPDNSPVTVKQLGPGPDYRPLLKEIKTSGETQFIVDCEADRIQEILKQAKEIELMDDYHSYFFTSLDTHTLDFGEMELGRANITTMRLVDTDNSQVQHIMRDYWNIGDGSPNQHLLSSNAIKVSTALIYDAVSLFAAAFTDLNRTKNVITTQSKSCEDDYPANIWKHGLELGSWMKKKEMDGLTGKIEFDPQGRRTKFTLQVIELAHRNEFLEIAKWNEEIEYSRSESERIQLVSETMSNRTFIVASRIGAPYLMLANNSESKEGNERYEGYALDLIDGISKILNFKYRFELVADEKYGNWDDKTKKWNGLIKEILERRADMAICDLTITYERRMAVDFTMPFMTLGISILYSTTAKTPPDLFSFMQPLSLDVWLYMATAYLGVSIMIFVVARMAPGDWENPHPCNQEPEELENIWNLKNSLWLTLGSIMAQGCDILPKGISTRMVAGMWWFFSLIMTASYTANLAAFLTMERMGPTIESAEDLAKQSKIKYGAVLGGATSSFFRDSNASLYQRMWATMESSKPSVFVSSNKDGKDRVLKSKKMYAFFMESTSIEYEIERNCDLTQIGGLLDSKGYGIALPMNSPKRTAISGAVLKMQEEGKLLQLKNKWWIEKGGGKCRNKNKAATEAATELRLANVGGVFVVLGVGVGIAFIIAILEFLWNVRKVAVEEHLSFGKALAIEVSFACNVFVTKKRVKPMTSESNNSSSSREISETRSLAKNALRNAGSFLRLDGFDKNSLNRQKQ